MAVPLGVRSKGGPFHVIFADGSNLMGFMTLQPAAERQVSNVAPRFRVGTDPGFNSETFDQLLLRGFEVGGDKELFETGDKQYQWSDGNVALQVPGRVTLASAWSSMDASITPTAKEIVDFAPSGGAKSWVCLGLTAKLRVMDTSNDTWSDAGTLTGATVKQLYATDQYLFIACGTTANFWRWDGTSTSTNFAQPGTGFQANCFCVYKEKLYRALSNQIIPATNNDGSTWGTAIDVGHPGSSIQYLAEANGFLVIGKPEGLYVYDENDVYRVIDSRVSYDTTNFVGMAEWQGAIILPWGNAVHKSSISSTRAITVQDITPKMKGDTNKEMYGHGKPVMAFAAPNRAFVAFKLGENSYAELLSYNGLGWHQIYRSSGAATMNAAGFSRLKGWLLVNDGSTRRKKVTNIGDAEFQDYAASGEFWTPALDGGFPDEPKAWRSFTVETEECDSNTNVAGYYRADGGSWVLGGTLTGNGKTELIIGSLNSQVSAKKLELRFVLTRNPADSTVTPKIKLPIIIRALARPKAIDAFHDQLILDLSEELANGHGTVGDYATMNDMMEFIDGMADSTNTIVRFDEWGRSRRVIVTDVSTNVVRVGDDDTDLREKRVAAIRMMDVFPGLARSSEVESEISLSVTTSLPAYSGISSYNQHDYNQFDYGQ